MDLMSLRNVTPERFTKLEKELVRGKSEIVSYIFLSLTPSSYLICRRGGYNIFPQL